MAKQGKASHTVTGFGSAMRRAAFQERPKESPPPVGRKGMLPLYARFAAAAGNFRRTGSARSGTTRTRT